MEAHALGAVHPTSGRRAGADYRGLSRTRRGDRRQELRHERSQICKAIGRRAEHYYGNRQHVQILLE